MAKIITENFRVQTTNELYRSFTEGNQTIVTDFTADMNTYVDSGAISLSNSDKTTLFNYFPASLLEIMNASQPDSTYYVMASSITKGATIENTQFQKREFQRRVIFGNKVTQSDIRYMFDINAWNSGTVYDAYDDREDISTLNMYVTVLDGTINEGSYKVYKCLGNNGGTASVAAPSTSDVDAVYEIQSDDGYVWKYMFSVPPAEYITYATATSLPYYADATVVSAAVESISDIIITKTKNQLFGANTGAYNLGNLTIQAVNLVDSVSNRWEIEVKTDSSASTPTHEPNAYTNMYIRTDNGALYDIDASDSPAGADASTKTFFVYITSVGAPSLSSDQAAFIVPKVEVSASGGTRALAYGELNASGTLIDVKIDTKGTHYKYATSTLKLPPALQDQSATTELRAIMSPRGGHGSDPISELYMSKLAVITNFFTSSLNNIPDSNTYTRVGLVKNPVFADATSPTSLDNRMEVRVSGDISSAVNANQVIVQTVGSETFSAKIHEVKYTTGSPGYTSLFLVDYVGDHNATFATGSIDIKDSVTSDVTGTYSINNVVNTGKYVDYSGDLLHFVDFDAIAREPERREKIKFVFDF
jgi:hypothetical protein